MLSYAPSTWMQGFISGVIISAASVIPILFTITYIASFCKWLVEVDEDKPREVWFD